MHQSCQTCHVSVNRCLLSQSLAIASNLQHLHFVVVFSPELKSMRHDDTRLCLAELLNLLLNLKQLQFAAVGVLSAYVVKYARRVAVLSQQLSADRAVID